ncbi:MAG: vWA domain-containing protein [Cetobacterium sp.]
METVKEEKKEIGEKAEWLVSRGQQLLMLSFVLFRNLICRVTPEVRWDYPAAMGTNGRTLYYNPTIVARWTPEETAAVLAHELLHCALQHPFLYPLMRTKPWMEQIEHQPTRELTKKRLVNLCMDFAIEGMLREMGLKMPAEKVLQWDAEKNGKEGKKAEDSVKKSLAWYEGQYKKWQGCSTMEIYDQWPEPTPEEQERIQALSQMGLVLDAYMNGQGEGGEGDGEGQRGNTPGHWAAAVTHAVKEARLKGGQAGKVPGELDRLVTEWTHPTVGYRDFLRRFMEQQTQKEYDWRRPSRRWLNYDIYLPSLQGKELGKVLVFCDTSGSMDNQSIAAECGIIARVIEEFNPQEIHIGWVDAAIANMQVYERGDDLQLKPKGGGGTDFRPAFEYAKGVEGAQCIIYITDLQGTFPEACEVELPTLWLATCDGEAPFGEVVRFEVGG